MFPRSPRRSTASTARAAGTQRCWGAVRRIRSTTAPSTRRFAGPRRPVSRRRTRPTASNPTGIGRQLPTASCRWPSNPDTTCADCPATRIIGTASPGRRRRGPVGHPLHPLDTLAFPQSGKKTYPIRRFGAFYVTAASGLNCPGDDPSSEHQWEARDLGALQHLCAPADGETQDSATRFAVICCVCSPRAASAPQAWSNDWDGFAVWFNCCRITTLNPSCKPPDVPK